MAKEFEMYNDKYRANVGKTLQNISRLGFTGEPSVIQSWRGLIPNWEYCPSYSTAIVRQAVYEGEGAEEWQFFRVGLKGLTTQEKLYCLCWYYEHSKDAGPRSIRINNYLGALIRGGQLNSKLEVVR